MRPLYSFSLVSRKELLLILRTSRLLRSPCRYLTESSREAISFEPTERTLRFSRLSRPLSSVIRLEKRDKSSRSLKFSSPLISSIMLKLRSSQVSFVKVSSPWIYVMMLLSSCSLVSSSIPNKLSISTISERKNRKFKLSYNISRWHKTVTKTAK